MDMTAKASLLFALAVISDTTTAATADDVQKAYENCLPMRAAGARIADPTPQARQEYAVEQCSWSRESSCSALNDRNCDLWVKLQLVNHNTLSNAQNRNIELPHTESFEPPPEPFKWPSDN